MTRRLRPPAPPAPTHSAPGEASDVPPSSESPPRIPTELEAAVARALDQELAWYFAYAEGAKRLGQVSLLPSHEATRLAAVDPSEEAAQKRGLELATTVQASLGQVAEHHAGVLRAVYTPRQWPVAIVREFGHLGAIAVRLVCAENPWPARGHHDGLETAAAKNLARALARDQARPAALRRTARRMMGSAIAAYVRARAKGGAPLANPHD